MNKSGGGNFFEDFKLGQVIRHATPRTVTQGDVALYLGLFGGRFAVQSSDAFAQAIGYPHAPIDDLLVFHIVFGKTVPDISLNAIANLGYAAGRFRAAVYPGDTLSAVSEVIGLRETSNKQSGVVYVRSTGFKADGTEVVDYVRWVMVRKRDEKAPSPEAHVPQLPSHVQANQLGDAVPVIDTAAYDTGLSGSERRFESYKAGEKIDHVDGITVEEAEHQIATRLYQNPARIHFNQWAEGQGRFKRRLIYGGHAISLARTLSFNGFENAFHVAGINARAARGAAVRRRYGVCLERSAGGQRNPRPQRRGCAQAAHGRHQGPALRRLSLEGGRGIRAFGDPRARLLGSDSALITRPRAGARPARAHRSADPPGCARKS